MVCNGSVWLEGWKSGKIKIGERVKKWVDRKYLVFLLCVWLMEWKSGEMKNFFVWLSRKVRE